MVSIPACHEIHSHDTRSSSHGSFYVKHSRLNQQRNSFSRIGVNIWNSIPAELRKLPKNNFKTKLHKLLLQVLKNEDVYVDVPTLMKTMAIGKLSLQDIKHTYLFFIYIYICMYDFTCILMCVCMYIYCMCVCAYLYLYICICSCENSLQTELEPSYFSDKDCMKYN